ncbi:MAG: guanylate kinase, partial [Bdellovibrionota bacterium]
MTSGELTKLIVISAPSGAGKTTLCQRLLADFPQLTLSISSTTRQPRGAE